MIFDGKSYSHNTHQKFMMIKEKYNVNEYVDNYQSLSYKLMFTQMNENKWIKLSGERAISDMLKEYKKLDDGSTPCEPVVTPFIPDGTTPLDRKKTLEAVKLIKEIRCVNIKGSTCANGSKQIKYRKLYESIYSPTCSTKALIATLVIDAMEQIDVTIFYVPGDFLKTALPADKCY